MGAAFDWLLRLFATPEPTRFESPSPSYPDAISLIAAMIERQRSARADWVSFHAAAPNGPAVVEFADDWINTCETEIDLRATLIAAGEPHLADLVDRNASNGTMHGAEQASPRQLAQMIRIILIAEHGASPDVQLKAELHG